MKNKYQAIVIGASAGGLAAFKQIIPALPAGFSIPIIAVQHISADSDNYVVTFLNNLSKIMVKEADEKESIKGGTVYFSVPNYHLLIERDKTFTFTTDQKVNYSRPSIDVLFETAADAYGAQLIGIILTGANHDGTAGLMAIKKAGGLTIAQDPNEAETAFMPKSAIKTVKPDYILSLNNILNLLIEIDAQKG